MSMDARAWRDRLADALLANPAWHAEGPETLARLRDPGDPCGFDDLGLDSVARLELCIWLETEAGVEVTEATLAEHPGLSALAAHLAARPAPAGG